MTRASKQARHYTRTRNNQALYDWLRRSAEQHQQRQSATLRGENLYFSRRTSLTYNRFSLFCTLKHSADHRNHLSSFFTSIRNIKMHCLRLSSLVSILFTLILSTAATPAHALPPSPLGNTAGLPSTEALSALQNAGGVGNSLPISSESSPLGGGSPLDSLPLGSSPLSSTPLSSADTNGATTGLNSAKQVLAKTASSQGKTDELAKKLPLSMPKIPGTEMLGGGGSAGGLTKGLSNGGVLSKLALARSKRQVSFARGAEKKRESSLSWRSRKYANTDINYGIYRLSSCPESSRRTQPQAVNAKFPLALD